MADVTSLGRAIDPSYPTNRALLVVMLGLGLISGLWQSSAMWGLQTALAVFFGWALTRELDPDRESAAFVSTPMVLVCLALGGSPQGPLFWLLLVTRLVNRTTGLKATWLDSLLVCALAFASLPLALLTAVAFAADGWLTPPHRRHYFFAALSLAWACYLYAGGGWTIVLDLHSTALASLVSVLGFAVIDCRQLSSTADATGTRLLPHRIRAGQILAFFAATCLTASSDGFFLSPFWCAVIGAATFRLISGLLERRQEPPQPKCGQPARHG